MRTASERTVREIAIANPATARVFESLGIDYCCGGSLLLSAACERANIPLQTALQMLEACEQSPGRRVMDDAPLGEITQHIVDRHHGFVRRESPRIQALLTKVCGKHGPAHNELFEVRTLFATLSDELAQHMMKEERILFPYIEALAAATEASACFATVESPISVMIADHENAGAVLAKLRELTKGFQPPESACPTFRALYQALEEFEHDLHWHVHLENNILFPRAIAAERERRNALSSAN